MGKETLLSDNRAMQKLYSRMKSILLFINSDEMLFGPFLKELLHTDHFHDTR